MAHKKTQEVLDLTINAAIQKSKLSFLQLMLLGFLAGCFIALAGAGANMGAYCFLADPATNGLGKMISGLIFPAGLMMVVFAGAELFTGNNLMTAALLDGKISAAAMVRNWIVVYAANLLGALFVAWAFVYTGMIETGDGMLQDVTVSIAVSKTSMDFGPAFVKGIFCNFLVCIAVWMGTGADSTVGKLFALFFPIWLFVAAGFEHSIANMFFIPAGILAETGAAAGLTWNDFFIGNLLPVTLGNIAGGCILVAGIYYAVYRQKKEPKAQDAAA